MFVTIILEVKKRFGSFKFFSFVCFSVLLKHLLFLQLLKFLLVLFKACCFHTCGSFDVYDYQVGINDEGTTSVSILP